MIGAVVTFISCVDIITGGSGTSRSMGQVNPASILVADRCVCLAFSCDFENVGIFEIAIRTLVFNPFTVLCWRFYRLIRPSP